MMVRLLLAAALLAAALVAAADPLPAAQAMTVLVTGANRGLGLEFARQLSESGHRVIGTARRPAAATELQELEVRVEQLDVADAGSVQALAQRLEGMSIDLLINNAGIMGDNASGFRQTDFEQAARVFEVNSIGPMRVTQALLDNLLAGEGRTVVQITSGLGSIGANRGGYYAYGASKAALNRFNSSLAIELADEGFTCVVMHPGWVQTDLGGPAAPLTPEQSVSGMLAVIAALTPEDTGRFLDYRGNELPW